ncbi:MAG: patatin-like phospholipase family protein [Proteobacteria bacterium]|nr:patatin-like phospholipase family protein [Pseudomonadota bacterium]
MMEIGPEQIRELTRKAIQNIREATQRERAPEAEIIRILKANYSEVEIRAILDEHLNLIEMAVHNKWNHLISYFSERFSENRLIQNKLKQATTRSRYQEEEFGEYQTEERSEFPLTADLISGMTPKRANFEQVMEIINTLAKQKGSSLPPLPPIKYLVAQGGGAKGAAYNGTVKAMDETGTLQHIKAVGGASAGAINAFMLGLGLNSEHAKLLISNLNFLDLNDYSEAKTTKIHSALSHSGKNFYNWACALMEHVTGDPNITFREYRELCKKNPNLKEMIFKGTRIDGDKAQEITFSADNEETADVRIVDAVRASMSFPGAFEPWNVMKKMPDGSLKIYGIFTDGGVLNNFPITVFNEASYEDPHYKRVDTKVGTQADSIPRNPCSVGLALCSKLKKLNPQITPFTPRLKALRLKGNIAGQPEGAESIEEELQEDGWTYYQLGKALVKHKLGLNPEDPTAKYKAHKDQTIQIYTEEVGTLEFALSPEKQKRIEESGYHAWMQWYKVKHHPGASYEADFSDDFFPRKNGKLNPNPTPEENVEHFLRLLTNYYVEILNEAQASLGYPEELQDPTQNQRLKFYAYMIDEAVKVLESKKLPKSVSAQDVLRQAFNQAVSQHDNLQRMRYVHNQHILEIVDEDNALETLKRLMQSDNIHDHEKALRLFKGKLSSVFKYMEESKGVVLGLAAQSGNPKLLTGMLEMLSITEKMLAQTQRELRYSLNMLLNEASAISMYKYAVDSKNSKAILPILLEHNIDPIRLDAQNKNAFHYAILAGDIEALNILVQHCKTNKINYQEILFGDNNDTIGHFLIRHGSHETLSKLRENPTLLKDIISLRANNGEGVNCAELAARLFFKDSVTHEDKELDDADSLATLRLHCGALGIDRDIRQTVKALSAIYNQKASEQMLKSDKLKKLIQDIQQASSDNMKRIVSSLSAQECLSILKSPSAQPGLNFLCNCAQSPALAELAKALFNRIYQTSYSKFTTTAEYAEFLKLITQKYDGQSPLYHAAVNNNAQMVTALRYYDVPVSEAGPVESPNALTAAGQAYACEAVIALMQSKPYISSVKVERRVPDEDGKMVMHYLASAQDAKAKEAIFAVLSSGAGYLHNLSSTSDKRGNTPFYYLVQNPKAKEILEYLILQGKGKTYNWYLDTYFDLKTQRKNGYTDLEWAYKTNPELAEFIAENLYDKSIGKNAEARINGEIATEEELSRSISLIVAQQAHESAPKLTKHCDFAIVEDYEPSTPSLRKSQAYVPHHKTERKEDEKKEKAPGKENEDNLRNVKKDM